MRLRYRKIRHAASEIAFIVIGVLIALAANSWWQARQDRANEVAYLQQLLADTRQNEQLQSTAIVQDSLLKERTIRMLRVFRSRAPLPPVDSIFRWHQWGASRSLNVVTGTYDLLLRADGIQLLRDDSVRKSLIDLDARFRATERAMDVNQQMFADLAMLRTGRMIFYLPKKNIDVTSQALDNAQADPFDTAWQRDVDWSQYRNDATAQTAFQMMAYLQNNNLARLRSLLKETQRLRRHLEAALSIQE